MYSKESFDVYVASCVETGGIYHYKLRGGKLYPVEVTPMDSPMYMVIEERKMYIVLCAPFGNEESGVVVYDIDDDGRLTNPSGIQSTHGEVGCHILVDRGEVYCANYVSGSVVKLPDRVIQHTGHGVDPDRQEGPHVHYVGLTPDGKYICATDLGLDTIFLYDRELNLHGRAKVPAGQGVRHLAFSEDGKWLFAANELKSTVTAFSYADGRLEPVDTCSAVPADFTGETWASAIRVKEGCVYVSNRGHDSIAKLSFAEGRLTLQETADCGGAYPRDFIFAGDYLLSTNQNGNTVTVLDSTRAFALVERTGVEAPLCVCVLEEK